MEGLHKKSKHWFSSSKRKWIAGFGLLFLSGFIIGIIYWNQIKRAFLHQKIKAAIAQKTNQLYIISIENLEMDEVAGSLQITNLELHYDSSRYLTLLKAGKAPPMLLKIKIPQLTINRVQTPRALMNSEINGGKLEISRPQIQILYTQADTKAAEHVPGNEIYKQILGNLHLIQLDTLQITNARVTARKLSANKAQFEINDVWLQLKDIAIDSISGKDEARMMFANSFEARCPGITWGSANGWYNYRLDSIHLLSESKRIDLKSLRIIPLLSEHRFAEKKKLQADRFDINLNQVAITGVHFPHLFTQTFEAENLTINSASIKIYRECNRKHDSKSRIGTYPQQRVAQIPIPLTIRQVNLHNTYLEYKELGHIVEKTGRVIFSQLNAKVSNITNQSKSIKANNLMVANINARFLKKIPVITQWTFYLAHPAGRFDLYGKTGAMEATTLNSITEPLGGARIEKGAVQSLEFKFKADDYKSDGTVKFLYNDLKIAILKRDEASGDLKRKKLLSWGANIVLKKNNPGRNNQVRIADVQYRRDTTRSMFYMSWRAIRQGLVQTVMPDRPLPPH